MRALTLALIFHFTLNPIVYYRGRMALKANRKALGVWTIIFITELLLYTSVYYFYQSLPASLVQFSRVLGTSWMLFLIYTSSLFLIFDIAYLLFKRHLNRPQMLFKQSRRAGHSLIIVTMIIVIPALSYGRYKFKNPSVNHLELSINKSGNKHNSLRILVAGDFHLGYTINDKDAQRMVDVIMEQNADLILLVGDIIDSSIEPLLEQNVGAILSQLKAPLGVYSCPGNHEYRDEAEEKMQFLNDVGITMLRDSVAMIDSSFYVIGREDWIIDDRMSTKDILTKYNVNTVLPMIMLNHSPYDLEEDSQAGMDIALYGHTHHGQAFPGNIATDMKFELAYGYKKKRDTHIYVTSGLGLAGPQHRIGTESEIMIMDVRF